MIKFFRNIRQTLIMENPPAGRAGKTSKYLKYAIGEIVLVVIGILIALQINNWNERRKQYQKEKVLLIEVKKALESDLKKEFIPALISYRKKVEAKNWIENYYANTEIVSNDTLTKYFRSYLGRDWFFVFNTAAFENLKSIGMDIITSDSLRSKISILYSYEYLNIKELNDRFVGYQTNHVEPLINDKINLFDQVYSKSEFQNLLNDNSINSRLTELNRRRRFLISTFVEPSKLLVESLIQDIDKELKITE